MVKSKEKQDISARLSIVIPAFNEEQGIQATLMALTDAFPGSEIIVVDDGSTDRTADQVRKFSNVRLLQHGFNRGYGAGLKTAMSQATRDYVGWFDADNEHKTEDLRAMSEMLDSQNLVAVLGQRSVSQNVVRGVGKFVIRSVGRLLKVNAGTDLNCGLRVFRRSVISRYLHLLPDGYSASMTSTIIMVEQGYPHAFHPLSINPRMGQSKVALSDGFEAIILLLRIITLFAPMRVFLRLSLFFILAGLAYGIGMAVWFGRGFPVAAAALLTSGVMLGGLSLVADQISQIRISALKSLPLSEDGQGEKNR